MTSLSLQIPQAGQLNSTEDVKVATSLTLIQEWAAGEIDTSNLSPTAGITFGQLAPGAGRLGLVTKTAAYAANSGELVVAGVTGAPFTVTLPAPSPNALVGVVAGASATGANPITVARHSADVINGLGLSSATSLLLGTPGAAVLLQSDGTNWFVIDGQRDTGWVALTLATNVGTGGGDFTAAGRLLGDRVWLRGVMQNNTGGTIAAAATWATVPASIPHPGNPGQAYFPAGVPTGPSLVLCQFVGATITVTTGIANGGQVDLGTCNYTFA